MMANDDGKPPIVEIELIETNCPICGSDDYCKIPGLRDFVYSVAGVFQYARCNECKHLYMNPRPSKDSLAACYPSTYAPYHLDESKSIQTDASHREQNSHAYDLNGGHKKSWVRRLFGKIPGLKPFLFWLGQDYGTKIPQTPENSHCRLLEIGCADGWFLLQAQDAGWQVDGIEMNAEATALARSRDLTVATGTFEDKNLPSNSREAIVFWMVLEHVIDPVEMLRNVFLTLNSGGSVAFSIPNGGGIERRVFGRWWLGYEVPRHLHVFTSKQIRTILKEVGFVDIAVQHQSNTRFWFGSFAAWGMERFPNAKWPYRWMEYFRNEPPRMWQILLLIPNKFVSALHCSGRITVTARKS